MSSDRPDRHTAAAEGTTPLDYARPAPGWIGLVAAAIGALALLWAVLAAAIYLALPGSEAAATVKLLAAACIPSGLVGLVLALAGMQHRRRLAGTALILNIAALALAAGGLIYLYAGAIR